VRTWRCSAIGPRPDAARVSVPNLEVNAKWFSGVRASSTAEDVAYHLTFVLLLVVTIGLLFTPGGPPGTRSSGGPGTRGGDSGGSPSTWANSGEWW
jgi:hypothetical protein